MLKVSFAVLRTYIEVIFHKPAVWRVAEGLPALNAKVALVRVAELLQSVDDRRELVIALHHQINIYDRLGPQAFNGGAADMLGADDQVTGNLQQP